MTKITLKAFTFSFIFALLPFISLSSQIRINELMASNSGTVLDPEFTNSSDWVELYNFSNQTIDLQGYFISDNLSNPYKWQILVPTVLDPGNHLLIWCDGMDTLLHTSFKLAAEGETVVLTSPQGEIIDSITYVNQTVNLAMGRICDGCDGWGYFETASPGTSNIGKIYDGIIFNEPYFYPLGNIFTSSQTVTIKNLFEGMVRYTLDGSEPTESSTLYTSPIQITNHTVVRARVFNGNKRPGPIITNSYFINDNNSIGNLPVVSISTNPDNLWDPVKGIYVQTFKPEWEIPINIELFENDGSNRAGFNLQAGTKINGLYSWQLPQKMLGIYFRKEYGSGSLEYPLFFDRKVRKFDSFALRASGNDWANTLFRDGMIQNSTLFNMNNETQGFRACVVFFNGQYMGIHNMRSKIDEDFIMNEFNESGQKIDMIENEKTVEAGSLNAYSQFETLYNTSDLTIQSNLDLVADQMDMTNFKDFMIAELYGSNSSVGHNVMAWKPKNNGKWRWIMNDFDRCLYDPTSTNTSFFNGKTVYPFSNLMKNANFKLQFGIDLADHLFTTFNAERIDSFMTGFANNIRNEIPRHIERWKGTSPINGYNGDPIPSIQFWENSMETIRMFNGQRSWYLMNDWLNYGFSKFVNLSVQVYPKGAGIITINNKKVPMDINTGYYPAGTNPMFKQKAIPGYKFMGWQLLTDTANIAFGDTIKYFDKGSSIPSNWMDHSFDDSSWSAGPSELGYGETDEATKISYGPSSSNKYPSYYFRKKFNINNSSEIKSGRIRLKADDGAVVYLNGKEIYRYNMPTGALNYNSLALEAIPSERAFPIFNFDTSLLNEGDNTLAVSVHQNSTTNSSDISFNLELITSKNKNQVVSVLDSLSLNLSESASILALYEDLNLCKVPEKISGKVILSKECSPYISTGDVFVGSTDTLIIEPGVTLKMAQNASLMINGSLKILGSTSEPVKIEADRLSGATQWGAILIDHATDTAQISNLIIEDASQGINPTWQVAAISIFHSKVMINHVVIENVLGNPIAARYSDVVVSNSKLHSSITGDLINFKYGKGLVEDTEFTGNDMPDTDAIDYDDIENGIIRNCHIHDFHGFNSDAIDIGERAKNVLIDRIFVHNITDKGVSVGQQSTATIQNSVFVNCNLGAGLKDSCHVILSNNTYYGCAIPVANYEKNAGSAGGNVLVSQSILSNAYDQLYLSDNQSTSIFNNNLFDADTIVSGIQNKFGDPLFLQPNIYNFGLDDLSPAKMVNTAIPWGAAPQSFSADPCIMITGIYNGQDSLQFDAEFIILTNPGEKMLDISGLNFTEGISWTAPSNSLVAAGESIILTNNASSGKWNFPKWPVFQWTSGKVNNQGERIRIVNHSGIIQDQVDYEPGNTWPELSIGQSGYIQLKSTELDNHFGKNWETAGFDHIVTANDLNGKSEYGISIYPNPATEYVNIKGLSNKAIKACIFNLSGLMVLESEVNIHNSVISLKNIESGIYIIQIDGINEKLIIK